MQYDDVTSEKSQNKRVWISIILIIILILLCLSLITFGKVTFGGSALIPTGHVDIFDINVANCPVCETCPTCNSCGGTTPVEPVLYQEADIIAYDDIDLINNQVNLRIFDKAAFEYDDKIAPGMYNSYHFIIRNNNDFNVLYNLAMTETNIYDINMKYRLKRDDVYVIGGPNTWVYASSLHLSDVDLSGNGDYHTYNLDWQWFDNYNDTYIGENAEEDYRLDINITAKTRVNN